MAAYGLAVQRVAEATTTRGLYPVELRTPAVVALHVRPSRAATVGVDERRGRHRSAATSASGARGARGRAFALDEVDITATRRSRRRTASGCRWSRSTASAPSRGSSIPDALRRALAATRLPDARRHYVTECHECHDERRKELAVADRLTVGVAARLSRYLQVLTQAKKMGKDRISSQEISDYTNINATQIRRDLSGFGKFGKRGVGYNIDSLLGEIRKILRTQGQHNIALVGAGRLGQAIASSPIFAEHGINIAAVFDTRPREGRAARSATSRSARTSSLADVVRDKNIIVGVLAVPADERPGRRRRPGRRGREDHLQLLGGAARRARPTSQVHTSNPAVELLYALYFHLT